MSSVKWRYPSSLLLDKSYRNFELKKKYFNSIPNLTLVPVSKWLEDEVRRPFLKNNPLHQIYNGIDMETFKPSFEIDIRTKYQSWLRIQKSFWEWRLIGTEKG